MVLTLVLTTVLALIAIGLSTYVMTALRASRVTDERTRYSAASAAALQWQIEEMTTKRSVPCASPQTITVPAPVVADARSVSLSCVPGSALDGHPTVVLTSVASSAQGPVTEIVARVQVPVMSYETHVIAWHVSPA
jgi:Tfp pilus assembly protein PilX